MADAQTLDKLATALTGKVTEFGKGLTKTIFDSVHERMARTGVEMSLEDTVDVTKAATTMVAGAMMIVAAATLQRTGMTHEEIKAALDDALTRICNDEPIEFN